MAKDSVPSILQLNREVKNGKIPPVIYIAGEDAFGIDESVKLIETTISPLITSDFDKETYYGEDVVLPNLITNALSFPFGSEKKLIIVKETEKIKDKKPLLGYIKSPPSFTIIIFIHNSKITNYKSEPYKTLLERGFLFEAKELKGRYLLEWLLDFAGSKGKILKQENASLLIEISGENRNQLENQLEKIFSYLGDKKEIDTDTIISLSTESKTYTVFQLQSALAKKNKPEALKIAFKLLENGEELIPIIGSLNRYFTKISLLTEVQQSTKNSAQIAGLVGIPFFTLDELLLARKNYSDKDLLRSIRALFEADIAVKSSTADDKTVMAVLIASILIRTE